MPDTNRGPFPLRVLSASSPGMACTPVQAGCAAFVVQSNWSRQDMKSGTGSSVGEECAPSLWFFTAQPAVAQVKYTKGQGFRKIDGEDQEGGLLGTV